MRRDLGALVMHSAPPQPQWTPKSKPLGGVRGYGVGTKGGTSTWWSLEAGGGEIPMLTKPPLQQIYQGSSHKIWPEG